MTVAVSGRYAWVACKQQSRIVRVATATGKTVSRIRLGGQPIAVVSGLGSVWALDTDGTLYRFNPSTTKLTKRVYLSTRAAYNLWIGGGSVWAADDQGAQVVRVSPRTGRVIARPAVGDGPADMAFDGTTAWVINHRDRVLTRIDLQTNRSTRLGVVPGDAPERMVWLHGSLWLTGRGTDLLQVGLDGSVLRTIEIGASGIDVVARGDDLYVPTRSATVDAGGFPTMDALKRVSATTGDVEVVARPEGRVDVHGLVVTAGRVWLSDNTNGRLYDIP
jgi:streptogramin lyase